MTQSSVQPTPTAAAMSELRDLINAGRYAAAIAHLSALDVAERDALLERMRRIMRVRA